MPITKAMHRAYRFYFANAGYVVGERAKGALELARAEQYSADSEWATEWVDDDCPDLSWMSEEEQQQPHEVLGCVLKDADGNVLASLWGITDPDHGYRRVVEAELAAETMHNEQQIDCVYAH